MKRIIAAIIISVMVLSFCSCGSKTEKPTESETSGASGVSDVSESAAEEPGADALAVYGEIIDEYKRAIQEGYPEKMVADYPEEGYLSFATLMNKPEKVYYTLVDLSDDNQPELFIAVDDYGEETDTKIIYDAWGCENGTPKRLYHNGFGWKHSLHINSDKTLLVDTRYAMGGTLELYTVNKNSAGLTGEGIGMDYTVNDETKDLDWEWCCFKTAGWHAESEDIQSISEDRYYEIEADMTGREPMSVDWIPIQ